MSFCRSPEWWRAQWPDGVATCSDGELAERLGCGRRLVSRKRTKLGIASYTEHQMQMGSTVPSPPPTRPSARSYPSAPSAPSAPATPRVHVPQSVQPVRSASSQHHRILFIPDTHAPYHDPVAWRTMLAVAQMWRPTCLVILGDFLDLYCVSSHPKDPAVTKPLEDEIAVGRDCLDELDALGVRHRYYIMGNHEHRLQRHIHKHSPMFDGLVTVEQLLSLDERGWQVTPYGDGREIGELFVTHDLNIAGKYAVRRSMDAAWSSVVIGHTHRLEVVHQTDARGRPVQGASFGWLGSFEAADYMKKRISMRQWSHGLGLCHMDERGRADVTAHRILDGRCRVDGVEVFAHDYRPGAVAA